MVAPRNAVIRKVLKGRLGLDTARVPHVDRHGLTWLARGALYVEDGTLRFRTSGVERAFGWRLRNPFSGRIYDSPGAGVYGEPRRTQIARAPRHRPRCGRRRTACASTRACRSAQTTRSLRASKLEHGPMKAGRDSMSRVGCTHGGLVKSSRTARLPSFVASRVRA